MQHTVLRDGADLGGGPTSSLALANLSRVLFICGKKDPQSGERGKCYHCRVFNLSRPKTPGQWLAHIVVGIIALFLVWWMVRVYVL